MPEQVEKREIEIDPTGDVAKAIVDVIERRPIQAIKGDIERMETTGEVVKPVAVLGAAWEALEESEIEGVPDDRDHFGVSEVDLSLGETSTVTIEVHN